MAKWYYTLAVYDETLAQWIPEFGDADKSVVLQELEDMHDAYPNPKRRHLKIVRTELVATQADIDQAVASLIRPSKRLPPFYMNKHKKGK